MQALCGHNNGALHRRWVKVAVVGVCSWFCEDEHERLILCEIVGRVEGVGITGDCMGRICLICPDNLSSHFDRQ